MSDKAPGVYDYVNSITYDKNYLEDISGYNPFMTNRSLSYHSDTLLYAVEMNKNYSLDNRMQYDYLFHAIRRAKRFAKWGKKGNADDLKAVTAYYKCSINKAMEALKILSSDELEMIKQKLEKGGVKK